MAAAVRSVKQGRYRLAARYARMSVRLIAGRFVKITEGARMRISTRIALAIVSLFGAVGIMAAAPAPAMAASQGPVGYITFWDGCNSGNTAGYCGAAWPIPQSQTLNTCYSVPSGSNDKFSAFSNNTSHNFRVYTAGSCGGSTAILYAGTETGQIDSPFNNSISSYRRIS